MEWKQSIHPNYEVSEYGDLRSLVALSNKSAGSELQGSYNKDGYRKYGLADVGCGHRGGKRKQYLAHRLVLFAFAGDPPEGKTQCAHYDGNPGNNHISNLRWASAADNTGDKIRHGNIYSGNRKLKSEDVLDMRAMREAGAPYETIREKYKVSKGNLSAIINRTTWDYI